MRSAKPSVEMVHTVASIIAAASTTHKRHAKTIANMAASIKPPLNSIPGSAGSRYIKAKAVAAVLSKNLSMALGEFAGNLS